MEQGYELGKAKKDLFLGFMNGWTDRAHKAGEKHWKEQKLGGKFLRADTQLRHLQSMPINPPSPSLKSLAEAMECTSFNWLMTPSNHNLVQVKTRFMHSTHKEIVHFDKVLKPLIEEDPLLYSFIMRLQKMITATSGLNKYPCYYKFELDEDMEICSDLVFEDATVQETAIMLQTAANKAKFDKNFTRFIEGMKADGLIGVEVDVEKEEGKRGPAEKFVLNSCLEKPIFQFYEVSAPLTLVLC